MLNNIYGFVGKNFKHLCLASAAYCEAAKLGTVPLSFVNLFLSASIFCTILSAWIIYKVVRSKYDALGNQLLNNPTLNANYNSILDIFDKTKENVESKIQKAFLFSIAFTVISAFAVAIMPVKDELGHLAYIFTTSAYIGINYITYKFDKARIDLKHSALSEEKPLFSLSEKVCSAFCCYSV